MLAPFRCDVDGINNERQIVLRKRNYVVALKGLRGSSKYRDIELNALITSAWLSLERSFMKSLSYVFEFLHKRFWGRHKKTSSHALCFPEYVIV